MFIRSTIIVKRKLIQQIKEPIKNYYNVIYADPPWQYSNTSTRASAKKNYHTMSIGEIRNLKIQGLKIQEITSKNAILFLWTTGPFLEQAFEIIKAWQFEYKTYGFNWIKTNNDGSLFMGMGNYTRNNLEQCLIGVKGKLEIKNSNFKNVEICPRLKHSEKPKIFHHHIEQICGDVKRLDLFARVCMPGWDSWGDELDIKK